MYFKDSPLIPLENTLRQIRSESFETDLVSTLDKIGASEGSSISIGHNYRVIVHRNSVLKAWAKNGDTVLTIDATGNVAAKPKGKSSFNLLKGPPTKNGMKHFQNAKELRQHRNILQKKSFDIK